MALNNQDIKTWIITDGKKGDLRPAFAVTDHLNLEVTYRQVNPSFPWNYIMPYFGVDPKEDYDQFNSPISPPFPDLIIGSGRKSVAYLKRVKDLSPETFVVYIKDPRFALNNIDLCVVSRHDKSVGTRVLRTPFLPHPVSQKKLELLRASNAFCTHYELRNVLVCIGGSSKHAIFDSNVAQRFVNSLKKVVNNNVRLIISYSRRTDKVIRSVIEKEFSNSPHIILSNVSSQEYELWLANADVIIVTAESINMIGEALATGRNVMIFIPKWRRYSRLREAIENYIASGQLRVLGGTLQFFEVESFDCSGYTAEYINSKFLKWKRKLTK